MNLSPQVEFYIYQIKRDHRRILWDEVAQFSNMQVGSIAIVLCGPLCLPRYTGEVNDVYSEYIRFNFDLLELLGDLEEDDSEGPDNPNWYLNYGPR